MLTNSKVSIIHQSLTVHQQEDNRVISPRYILSRLIFRQCIFFSFQIPLLYYRMPSGMFNNRLLQTMTARQLKGLRREHLAPYTVCLILTKGKGKRNTVPRESENVLYLKKKKGKKNQTQNLKITCPTQPAALNEPEINFLHMRRIKIPKVSEEPIGDQPNN